MDEVAVAPPSEAPDTVAGREIATVTAVRSPPMSRHAAVCPLQDGAGSQGAAGSTSIRPLSDDLAPMLL